MGREWVGTLGCDEKSCLKKKERRWEEGRRGGCENEDSPCCLSVEREGRRDARGGVQSWRQLEREAMRLCSICLPALAVGRAGMDSEWFRVFLRFIFFWRGDTFFFTVFLLRMGNPRSSRLP